MKHLLFLLAFALTATLCHAQTDRFYYPDAFYFVKEVKVDAQKGKPFHFDLSVKENPADSLSRPRIYAIQVRKGKEDVIGKTLTYARANTGDWNTYSIDGTVDTEATRIWLYVAVNGNGDFHFDNLHFYIAGAGGVLHKEQMTNASFEEKKLLIGYFVSKMPPSGLQVKLSPLAADGLQSVEVISSGQRAAGNRSFASN